MRICQNMMASIQRRVGWTPPGFIKRDLINKTPDHRQSPQIEKVDDRIKSPTERLLSTYFDVEV